MNSAERKRFLGNIILLITTLSIVLCLAELVLRKFVVSDSVLKHRIPHPVLGWVLEPNMSYDYHMEEGKIQVAYNSKGFRDVEHTEQKPDRVFRILVLGDSFIEAYSVQHNEAFHKRLEEFSGERGIDVEVINMGVGGYGTLQEYLLLRDVGQGFDPDLVLLGFYIANDVRNNSMEIESLIYSGMMKVDSRPFLDPVHEAVYDDDWKVTRVDFEGALSRYEAEKYRRSTILGKVALAQLIAKFVRRDNQVSYKKSNMLGQYGVSSCAEPPEYKRAWSITERILARLKRDVDVIGSSLVVYSVPALQDTSSAYMKKVKLKIKDPDQFCFEEAPGYKRLRHILNELGIEYLDLLPEFRKATKEGRILFRQSDRHWNPEGHSLAARKIIYMLEKNKLLPAKLSNDT